MKKLGENFLIGTAFAASMAALTSCAPVNENIDVKPGTVNVTTEIPVAVYGPPEDLIPNIDITAEINGDVYGPPPKDS